MLNPTTLLADALGQQLTDTFRRGSGGREPQRAALLDETARLIIERLATSDALYHTAVHTAFVTLCAQDMLRGIRLTRRVSPEDWLHFLLATLMHDIGYVRGVCGDDRPDCFV